MMDTLYGELSASLQPLFKSIKLVICDVDGVFSDGRIYLGNQGEELKAFHTRDGFGVKALISSGVEVAVITGRNSKIVEQRMQALNVKFIYQGVEDKTQAFKELLSILKLSPYEVAYVGDDTPDKKVMQLAGLSIAVADAHPSIRQIAQYTTVNNGGFGAVREICDLTMQVQGTLEQANESSI